MEAVVIGGRIVAIIGTRSQQRRTELDEHGGLRQRPIDISGLRQHVLATGDSEVWTPCGMNALRRRRAKNKVAKQSRKVNRAYATR